MVSTSSTTWLSARKAKANERKKYLESLRPTYASREINRTKAEKATRRTCTSPSVKLNTDTLFAPSIVQVFTLIFPFCMNTWIVHEM